MRIFIPKPHPAREAPAGARPLALKTPRRIVGAPEKILLGYDGPGDRHYLVPGINGPDAFVIDLTGLRTEHDVVEVLAYSFMDLGWRETASYVRRRNVPDTPLQGRRAAAQGGLLKDSVQPLSGITRRHGVSIEPR